MDCSVLLPLGFVYWLLLVFLVLVSGLILDLMLGLVSDLVLDLVLDFVSVAGLDVAWGLVFDPVFDQVIVAFQDSS